MRPSPRRCTRCGETPCAMPWSEQAFEVAMVPLGLAVGLAWIAYRGWSELRGRVRAWTGGRT